MQTLRNLLCSDDHISLTFHRAFDICSDWQTAMDAILLLRCDRLLTSGREQTALQGVSFLAQLQINYGNAITIVAASGIKAESVQSIISKTNVTAVHIGSGIDEAIHDAVSESAGKVAFQDMVMRIGASKQKTAELMEIIWWNLPLKKEDEEGS